MIVDRKTVSKIRNVLIVAEQGSQTMAYGDVYRYNDGPRGVKQITLSIGFTQYGNLRKVLEAYGAAGGVYSEQLGEYADDVTDPQLVNNTTFINLLKDAGRDPVMQEVQNEQFDKLYLQKGIDWGEAEGFSLPLSFLVICDSFLHSGSILMSIRKKFSERTPKFGGNEKEWINQYTNARHSWLANHSITILHNTIYRTKYYKLLIGTNDWLLDNFHLVEMNGLRPLAVV